MIYLRVISLLVLVPFILLGKQDIQRNHLNEINDSEGKIKLKLVRTWGGDETDDENQYFKFPSDIKVSKEQFIYIVDSGNNRIQIFDGGGNLKKRIGQKGQGPGDFLAPEAIAFDNNGNLLVADYGNYRIQTFSAKGDFLHSFKTTNINPSFVAITSKNEIAVYNHRKAYLSNALVFYYNSKGKITKQIGNSLKTSKSIAQFESHMFAIDKDDNVIVANYATPLIRKYSSNGDLLLIVTYEVPFKTPRIELSQLNKEPAILGNSFSQVAASLTIDNLGRLFLVTTMRKKNKDEIFFLVGGAGRTRRYPKKIPSDKTDRFRLIVFNKNGKVIASERLAVFCDKIYIQNNRLFIIDKHMGIKIYEYKINIK